MYGNYSHFMRFPQALEVSISGFNAGTVWRDRRTWGEIRITGLGLNWEGGHIVFIGVYGVFPCECACERAGRSEARMGRGREGEWERTVRR